MPKLFNLLAAALGTTVAVLADLFHNLEAATTFKLASSFQMMWPLDDMAARIVAAAVLVLLSATICWVYEPSSKADAFARGLAIFSLFTVGVPYQPSKGPLPQFSRKISQAGFAVEPGWPMWRGAWVHLAAAPALDANATVLDDRYAISSCKPSYAGIFGLTSFLTNRLDACSTTDALVVNQRVRILAIWVTSVRQYRYAKIEYLAGGALRIGWTLAGQGTENAWLVIKPDNPNEDFRDAPS